MDAILQWIWQEGLPWLIAMIFGVIAQRFRKSGGVYAKALRVVTDAIELVDVRNPQAPNAPTLPDSARGVKRLTQALGETEVDKRVVRAIDAAAKASEFTIRKINGG